MQSDKILLDVRNLKVCFATETSDITAVEDVSFQVKKGETVALVVSPDVEKCHFTIHNEINKQPWKNSKRPNIFEEKDL